MKIFFTGDHHFNHKNVIKYCERPFESIEIMDAELIKRWNEKVSPNDVVYHLGDFCLNSLKLTRKYFSQLNGDIHILDNFWHHDKMWIADIKKNNEIISTKSGIVSLISPIFIIKTEGKILILSHYPQEEWDRKHYGAIHFHGHSHGNSRKMENRFDIGVDCWNFYPVALKEILGEK